MLTEREFKLLLKKLKNATKKDINNNQEMQQVFYNCLDYCKEFRRLSDLRLLGYAVFAGRGIGVIQPKVIGNFDFNGKNKRVSNNEYDELCRQYQKAFEDYYKPGDVPNFLDIDKVFDEVLPHKWQKHDSDEISYEEIEDDNFEDISSQANKILKLGGIDLYLYAQHQGRGLSYKRHEGLFNGEIDHVINQCTTFLSGVKRVYNKEIAAINEDSSLSEDHKSNLRGRVNRRFTMKFRSQYQKLFDFIATLPYDEADRSEFEKEKSYEYLKQQLESDVANEGLMDLNLEEHLNTLYQASKKYLLSDYSIDKMNGYIPYSGNVKTFYHGGGLLHIIDFLIGSSQGYTLENTGYNKGLQLNAFDNRSKLVTYAYDAAKRNFDTPAYLKINIPPSMLEKANNLNEAGLLKRSVLHPDVTWSLTADNGAFKLKFDGKMVTAFVKNEKIWTKEAQEFKKSPLCVLTDSFTMKMYPGRELQQAHSFFKAEYLGKGTVKVDKDEVEEKKSSP